LKKKRKKRENRKGGEGKIRGVKEKEVRNKEARSTCEAKKVVRI